MDEPRLFLNDINDFLQQEFAVHRYPATEQGGIYYPSERPVKRIGLLLEPFSTLPGWVNETYVDALWIHRPWQLNLDGLPPDLGIVSHHLPFDETLTMGFNTRLAEQLGAVGLLEPLGYKQALGEFVKELPKRPIGMIFDGIEQEFDHLLTQINTVFGGYDRAEVGNSQAGWRANSCRIAVVGAMTDELVREAAGRGAHLYLTGAYRKPGQPAIDETGMAFIAVGHRRSEEWGLRALATLLPERWPELIAVTPESDPKLLSETVR
ncbi:Nif3-like dinuclear metal center hexameric protein [Spirosoma areae]